MRKLRFYRGSSCTARPWSWRYVRRLRQPFWNNRRGAVTPSLGHWFALFSAVATHLHPLVVNRLYPKLNLKPKTKPKIDVFGRVLVVLSSSHPTVTSTSLASGYNSGYSTWLLIPRYIFVKYSVVCIPAVYLAVLLPFFRSTPFLGFCKKYNRKLTLM